MFELCFVISIFYRFTLIVFLVSFDSQCSVPPPHGAIGKSAMCVIVVNSGHTHLLFFKYNFGLIVLFCLHHSVLLLNIASLYQCFQAHNLNIYRESIYQLLHSWGTKLCIIAQVLYLAHSRGRRIAHTLRASTIPGVVLFYQECISIICCILLSTYCCYEGLCTLH